MSVISAGEIDKIIEKEMGQGGCHSGTLYKCSKKTNNIVEPRCKWNGHIEDYPAHVKLKHRSSYFSLPRGRALFQWTLPHRRDQIDTGIFEFDTARFVYEISYEAGTATLYFSMKSIADSNTRNKEYFYDFLLVGHGKSAKYCSWAPRAVYKTCAEGVHVIGVSRETLEEYWDAGRRVEWRIEISEVSEQ